MPGDSFSSLVDRLVVESGGEMYPVKPGFEAAAEAVYEYGGGGPE